jgi:putative protease
MELLAPAGDFKKLKFAIKYGADALYFGVPQFSLRGKRVNKFKETDIQKGIDYAHRFKKKVYLTLNIYPHNEDLKNLEKYLPSVIKLKPDALIVSDPGVINLIRNKYPKQEIHLSTQANCLNYGAAQFWKDQGIKRIILARETKIEEIKEINQKVKGLELEYFCHGAMCMSYSGRCMLSAWINQKSANKGDCTQPCRWPWQISEPLNRNQKRNPKQMILEENNQETYLFNSKDLCLIEHLDKLKKAGVKSIKIEGRNKSLYYLATIVKYYRKVLDLLESDPLDKQKAIKEALSEFSKLGNRKYTTGFAFGLDEKIQNYKDSRNLSDYQMIGELVDSDEIKKIKALKLKNVYPIFVHNAIYLNQKIDAISPNNLKPIKALKIFNHKLEEKPSAHGGTDKIWFIQFDEKLDDWVVLRGGNYDSSD